MRVTFFQSKTRFLCAIALLALAHFPPISASAATAADDPTSTTQRALLDTLGALHGHLHALSGETLATTATVSTSLTQTSKEPSSDAAASDTKPGGVILAEIAYAYERARDSIKNIEWADWLAAFFSILAAFILRRLFSFILHRKAKKWAASTKFDFDDLLVQCITPPILYFPIVMGFIAAGLILGFRVNVEGVVVGQKTIFGGVAFTLLICNLAWLAYNLVNVVTHLLSKLAKRTETTLDNELVPLIDKSLKIIVVLMAFITLGGMVGGPFKGILAGLGLGGLAFALAAKDTVANLFGYVVLFADRPFRIGDVVEIAGAKGKIAEMGVRSLKIRTLSETLVTIPNSEVANAQIENFTRRDARRAFMYVGLTYDTTADQMEKIIEAIRAILDAHPDVHTEKSVVSFETFNDSSLDIRVYYYTRSIGLAGHLRSRQEINLSIMRAVESHGLSMAFPTRSVYIEHGDAASAE